ncbi:hypothetical protein P43SY_004244 [Pythium insidiosum]|uniref:Transmembrane protein n=1 Tax=Pythium insidiosum TaxID=114742 RepID=A0AAD5Q3Q7_PYTIN|nr:hypothetical protein P43SY_004244 [Pythium insidiosum]
MASQEDVGPLTAEMLMHRLDESLFQPLTLLINFSLFQYLLMVFFRRRREPRVSLLLVVAFLSFATLVPFANPDKERMVALNDMSEVCSTLTFLIQISILSRDVNRKLKMRSVAWLVRISEAVALVSLVVLSLGALHVAAPSLEITLSEDASQWMENISLVFIVFFRFYFLAMAKGGTRQMLRSHKRELVYYTLFLTHEYPFMGLNAETGLDWERVQGVYMRLLIVLCLWSAFQARFSSHMSNATKLTTNGPVISTRSGGRMDSSTSRMRGPSRQSAGTPTGGSSVGRAWGAGNRAQAAVAPLDYSFSKSGAVMTIR